MWSLPAPKSRLPGQVSLDFAFSSDTSQPLFQHRPVQSPPSFQVSLFSAFSSDTSQPLLPQRPVQSPSSFQVSLFPAISSDTSQLGM